MTNAGILALLLLIGIVLIVGGGAAALSNFGKRRATALGSSLTRVRGFAGLGSVGLNFAGWQLKLAILAVVLVAVATPAFLLKGEAQRADRAETEVVIANGNTRTSDAGADQARAQLERTADFYRERNEERARADAGVAELERLGHEGAATDLAVLHAELVRGVRVDATSAAERAAADYCRRNADPTC